MKTLKFIIILTIAIFCFAACNDSDSEIPETYDIPIINAPVSYNHLPEDASYDGAFIFISAEEQDLLADLAQTLEEDSEYIELLEKLAYGDGEDVE